jgi:hypothetical protein
MMDDDKYVNVVDRKPHLLPATTADDVVAVKPQQ